MIPASVDHDQSLTDEVQLCGTAGCLRGHGLPDRLRVERWSKVISCQRFVVHSLLRLAPVGIEGNAVTGHTCGIAARRNGRRIRCTCADRSRRSPRPCESRRFGHSGSHTSQLMHWSVMISAMRSCPVRSRGIGRPLSSCLPLLSFAISRSLPTVGTNRLSPRPTWRFRARWFRSEL